MKYLIILSCLFLGAWGPHGGGFRGGHEWHGGDGGGFLGGILGGVLGGWIAGTPSYDFPPEIVPGSPGWYAYCTSKYRSFDPATATFLGLDGMRHPCS